MTNHPTHKRIVECYNQGVEHMKSYERFRPAAPRTVIIADDRPLSFRSTEDFKTMMRCIIDGESVVYSQGQYRNFALTMTTEHEAPDFERMISEASGWWDVWRLFTSEGVVRFTEGRQKSWLGHFTATPIYVEGK